METYTGSVWTWSADTGAAVLARLGGGPNACVVGSDGATYVTQNGGHVGGWVAPAPVVPGIQRIAADGSVTTVVRRADGQDLLAPNDLAFGPDGSLYFTDSGRFLPDTRPDPGRICVVRPDGTASTLVDTGKTYPNGIAVAEDGTVFWVQTYTRTVHALTDAAEPRLIAELPEGHAPDGLAVGSDGRLWITVTAAGGIDVVDPGSGAVENVGLGHVPLNCAFDGQGGLVVTDFGTFDTSGPAHMVGSLDRYDVGDVGARVHRGSIA